MQHGISSGIEKECCFVLKLITLEIYVPKQKCSPFPNNGVPGWLASGGAPMAGADQSGRTGVDQSGRTGY